MKRFTYNELNDIIKNQVIEPKGVRINIKRGGDNSILIPYIEDARKRRVKIDINKLIDYFDELKQLNIGKDISDIAVTHFIHDCYNITNKITPECELLYLGNFEYNKVIEFIIINAVRHMDKRLFLLKWSDGLYTPINLHEPSLAFYVDLKETE